MTSEPGNLVLAVVCLLALVLAGGFTQAIVPENSNIQFTIQQDSGNDCPPGRLIRPCSSTNFSGNSWQVQLFEPFLAGVVEGNSSSSASSDQTGSASESGDTQSSSAGEASSGPPNGSATGGNGQSPRSANDEQSTLNPQATSLGLGSGFDWLFWPVIAALTGIGAIGVGLGLRDSSFESLADLRRVPSVTVDVLLGGLVGLATVAATWLRTQRSIVLSALANLPEKGRAGIRTNRSGKDRPSVESIQMLLAGLYAWLFSRLNRPTDPDEYQEEPQNVGPTQQWDLEGGDMDIRRAWQWLAQQTGTPDSSPRTPDDIARDAIDRGYPRTPVRELLHAFRDVTYGDFPPSGDRVGTAREAYEALRTSEPPAPGGEDNQ